MQKSKKENLKEIQRLISELLKEENTAYEIGEEITFKTLEWNVVKDNGDTIELLAKNVLSADLIKAYSDDDFMINGSDVRHTDTIRPISWEDSYIYKTILPNFKEDLGIEGVVTLLSREEFDALPEELKKCNDWYWTRTPRENGESVSGSTPFAYVYGDGDSYSGLASPSGLGVRPLLSIRKEFLEEID